MHICWTIEYAIWERENIREEKASVSWRKVRTYACSSNFLIFFDALFSEVSNFLLYYSLFSFLLYIFSSLCTFFSPTSLYSPSLFLFPFPLFPLYSPTLSLPTPLPSLLPFPLSSLPFLLPSLILSLFSLSLLPLLSCPSCGELSAGSDSREEEESFYRKRKSQLNVIFSVLGTPVEVNTMWYMLYYIVMNSR